MRSSYHVLDIKSLFLDRIDISPAACPEQRRRGRNANNPKDMMVFSNILVCIVSLIPLSQMSLALADNGWFSHEVSITEGVGTVTAELKLLAPSLTTYKVLADYAHWPDLFPRQPVIQHIFRDNNRVQVAMLIPAQYLPFNLKLVTSTLETPPHRLETTLVEGDFDRYDWTWNVSRSPSDTMTVAMLTLVVQPSIWIPEWLFRWFLESELTTHFHLLRTQVLAHHHEQQRVPPFHALPDP